VAFAIAAAVPFILTPLFASGTRSAGVVVSAALTALILSLGFVVTWERAPIPLRTVVVLSYFGVVFLLRNSVDTTPSSVTPLFLLPVIWLALYGTLGELIAAFVALALALVIPILIYGAPRYPASTEWQRTISYMVIAPMVGLTIHRLVADTRARARHLKQSEAVARTDRDMLAGVLRASTEYAIIGSEPTGVINVFNSGAERMLGYSADEVIHRCTPEVFHDPEEIRTRAAQLGVEPGYDVLVAAARTGEPETRDWSYVRKDGERLTVSLTVTPIDGPAGAPAGFIGVARDVGVQRNVERALRESEARHRLLVQNLPDALICLFDCELRLLLIEGPMAATPTFAVGDLTGLPLSEAIPAEGLGELEPHALAALRGDSSQMEYSSPRTGVIWDVQIAPYRDDAGEILGVFVIARDVTERRLAEAHARAAEASFASVYENAPIGIALIGADARTVSVNPALSALTGVPAEEFIGRPARSLNHPDDRDRDAELMRSLLAGERDGYHVEKRYVHADGHVIDVEVDCVLVRDADGKPLHTVSLILDATERKRQATMRERELSLSRREREQLAQQNARLVELDHMKDEFVALVSHELRTPLTSIVGYLELVLDGEAGPVTSTQERFLHTIDRNARALSTIVGDLLFLASLDAGKLKLHTAEVDLEQLLSDAVDGCCPLATSRGIAVTVEADQVPAVQGDGTRLAQLADNLLTNAIKFTPDGGHVDVRAREDGRRAIIEISDSGIGIPADEIPRLFTRFYRASTATQQHISGTGLGLAVVKSIVDAHHGAIEVDSSPGVGTTMRVQLPVK
jgi:PAS domain S-box-containing protein